ncbi:HNH endonuclease signature motif containing protein [Arthrobacter alpinus]|nr:HNH endonuclease signature motif containing protein [Arthrobacter alpinus]
MGNSMGFPMNRENASATATVADLIAGLTLPVIEPLASDIEPLLGLPPLPPPENLTFPHAGPHSGTQLGSQRGSQIEGVRGLMDSYGDAIAAMRRHQNQCAAHVAVLVERLDSLSVVEGGLVALDVWQKGGALAQITAELAIILHVGEGAAGRLIEQSVTLVRQLPATMEVLSAGELSWEHAVIIAEETSLLRSAHVAQATIDAFEQRLLEHAANKTPPSFRSAARRLRERSYPETITSRTRHAFAERSLRVTRGQDGMSWLSLYAPAPTIEAIWDQCHFTAQAARGPHEGRTQTQLRADVAAALLLRQSMDQNGIHSPATVPVPARSDESDDLAASDSTDSRVRTECGESGGEPINESGSPEQYPWYLQPEPNPCGEGAFPDPNRRAASFSPCQIPDFDDPNYNDPAFQEPDRRNQPEWNGAAHLPALTPAGTSANTGLWPNSSSASFLGEVTGRHRMFANDMGTWPPLPQVTPIVLIPALSLLGGTNELAWMEGAGPISMEVAKRLASQASSMLRVLVDPISNEPLDIAPDRYRISQAMRTMLRITEEYCQFPGCLAKAITCDVDHVKSFETGGRSIYNNLENLCSHHHLLKHFKDDKDRHGKRRCIDEPERQDVRLRGWTPCVENDGRVSWTSPSGRYCPPNLEEKQPPAYPKWLKKLIARAVNRRGRSPEYVPDQLRETELAQAFSLALEEAVAAALARAADVEETWDPDNLPEPPAPTPYDEEDDEIRTQMAFETARRNPHLGLPYAA